MFSLVPRLTFLHVSLQRKKNAHKKAYDLWGTRGPATATVAAKVTCVPDVTTADANAAIADAASVDIVASSTARRSVYITFRTLEERIDREVSTEYAANHLHNLLLAPWAPVIAFTT